MRDLPTKPFRKRSQPIVITPFMLRKTARVMLPFYKKIAEDGKYAARWSRDVRTANLTDMIRLFQQVVPCSKHFGFSVNGIGYFIDVPVPKPAEIYSSSIDIPPGLVQFHFNTRAHREVAGAILPLYWAIARSKQLASAILEAVRQNNLNRLNRIIRALVKSPYLQKIELATLGFSIRFKFPFEKYPYEASLFYGAPL